MNPALIASAVNKFALNSALIVEDSPLVQSLLGGRFLERPCRVVSWKRGEDPYHADLVACPQAQDFDPAEVAKMATKVLLFDFDDDFEPWILRLCQVCDVQTIQRTATGFWVLGTVK